MAPGCYQPFAFDAPPPLVREDLGRRYLKGHGIEIGALHRPLPVSRDTRVTYVDRYSGQELVDFMFGHDEIPKDKSMKASDIVRVDRVDDGETLATFEDETLDFVIANHVLEHTENPIQVLLNWFRVLRGGGVLFVAIPDKRFTFDLERPITPLSHLIEDFNSGVEGSREAHYRECAAFVLGKQGQALEEEVKRSMELREAIHFHVWTQREFLELLLHVQSYVDFDVMATAASGHEFIVVCQKAK